MLRIVQAQLKIRVHNLVQSNSLVETISPDSFSFNNYVWQKNEVIIFKFSKGNFYQARSQEVLRAGEVSAN